MARKQASERTQVEDRTEGRLLRKRWLAPLLLLASLLTVYGDVVLAGKGFFMEDLTLYHHPMKKVVREAVRSGEFPWWNPYVGAGQPLAANPAYELFYPGQWPVYFGEYDVMFQGHIVLHAFLAALGMYLLAQSMGVGRVAAALGGVAYGAGGPMLSATKLLPFMFALTWVPYVALFVRRYLADGNRRDLAAAVAFAAMQLLIGEPVTVIQTWMIIGTYAVWRGARGRATGRELGVAGGRLAAVVVLSAALAAVQILPALDHARDSVRSRGLSWEVASNWSTPPQRAFEILFPGLYRQIHDENGNSLMRGMYGHDVPYIAGLYVGLLPVLLAGAFLLAEKTGRRWIVGGLLVLCGLSVGAHFPLFRLAYESGVLRSIRYPEKFMFGIFFVVCLLASAGAQRLADGDPRFRRIALMLVGLWLAVAVLGVLVGGSYETDVPESRRRVGAVILDSREYWLGAVPRGGFALLVLWAAARGRRRFSTAAVVAAVIITAAELRLESREIAPVIDRGFFAPPSAIDVIESPAGRLYHRAETAWWTDHDPTAIRLLEDERYVWQAFRQGAFPLVPTASGVPVVLNDDLDETFLLPTAEFREVWGVVRRASRAGEAALWQMAGVEWVGDFDPRVSGEQVGAGASPIRFRRVARGGIVWFAASVDGADNPDEFRARVASGSVSGSSATIEGVPFDPASGIVERVRSTWSRIEATVDAHGRSFLVVSVTPHKYWAATIDGEPVDLVRTNVGFQGLEVPGGRHVVRLEYRNPVVVAGGVLSGLTIALLVLIAVVPRRTAPG